MAGASLSGSCWVKQGNDHHVIDGYKKAVRARARVWKSPSPSRARAERFENSEAIHRTEQKMSKTLLAENRKKTAKGKGRPFPKGVTGNPGGRPKRTPQEIDLIAACKDKTPAALAVMVEIMEYGEIERNRLAAAQAIIERAYGKPVQPTDNKHSGIAEAIRITNITRTIVDPRETMRGVAAPVIGADSELETVGAVHRAEDKKRKIAQ